ncbi:MAG: MBL fold metallo-hydrolase [Ignavibacteria bacterium]|nr:MBL fold metallo-hydrolase [Ignavibacteria bacterium]
MKAVILGSGTSTGVPTVSCTCDTCLSTDPHDKRLRTSLLIRSDTTTVVIDTSSDFRQQMLTHTVLDIHGVVYTHHHFDHIGGFDDLRPYSFRSGSPVEVYGTNETLAVIRSTFPYAFGLVQPTGASTPNVHLNTITQAPFTIGDIPITPIPLLHGSMNVNGYRIGNLAYCTDTNNIPSSSMELLRGLDTLILDGLRWKKHPTHFSIPESLHIIEQLQPGQTYLTHIAHQVLHTETSARLPVGVALAYDNLELDITTA